MEIYYKLINIFPNVDRAYIKTLCPVDWAPGDRDAQVADLVEKILSGGDAVPKIVANNYGDLEEMHMRASSFEAIYGNLLEIFPDADPHFLKDFAKKNVARPDSLKKFIERNLKHRDYPTREQYRARLKITEQQEQYTREFNVEQFLSIIPDPEKYFKDAKRGSKKSMNDILLLQETAYINHKDEIIEYIAKAKKAEKDEFQMLKAQKLLLECECCFNTECVPSKCSNCDNGHIFCNECIVIGTNAKLGDGETHISCFINCGSEFSLSVLQRILPPTTFSVLLEKRQAAEVTAAGIDGLVACPFCYFASIPPEGDKIFKCLNTECAKESCRLCKGISHVPFKCNDPMESEKARLYIEEKMTAVFARTCYKCKTPFIKDEGCNKIICICGAMMCYCCDQPIRDYTHFQQNGCTDPIRCPLFSDKRIEEVAIRKVAEKAHLELLKRNPNTKIDMSNLLPVIPLQNSGFDEELPRRVRLVLNLPPTDE